MGNEAFVQWLAERLEEEGWKGNELARRAGLSSGTISKVMTQAVMPTWEFCLAISRALRLRPEVVFRKAGLLPSRPAAVEEEEEVTNILRDLPANVRETVVTMLRALAGRPAYSGVAEAHKLYNVAETELERQLLEIFRNMDERWQEIILEDMRALLQNRLLKVKFIGEEEPANETASTTNEAA